MIRKKNIENAKVALNVIEVIHAMLLRRQLN